MEKPQDILDDYHIENKAYAVLENELRSFSFWLKFSAVLLLIVGVLGSTFGFFVVYSGQAYYTSEYIWSVGMFCSFLVAIVMSYYHYKTPKKIQTFCLQETDDSFESFVAHNSKNWRLLAFAVLFSCLSTAQLIGIQTYYEYATRSNYYEQVEEVDSTEPVIFPNEE